jgi:molecular chaperone GrpE (heat shock protein)
MNDATNWKIAKWPFLLGDALLLAFAYFIVWKSPHPISQWEIIACFVSAGFGTVVGILPFILDYRAIGKVIEANALGAVAEKIQNLEQLAAQITSATNQWEIAQGQAEKTSAGAKGIADKMTAEVREFSEFMGKMNDSEKATLRLEAEKLHRGETEWLQVLVRILDHVFALHAAAAHSGQPKLAEQITQFQNACHGVARRIGLTPFIAAPDEPFNAERHQAVDTKEKPPADAVIAETVGSGYTFQGRLLRPALVRLREKDSSAASATEKSTPAGSLEGENAEEQLPLGSPD